MTPALAFFYGGLVRSKNSLNTMMMSFAALGVVGIVWALVAYSLAFAEGGAWIGSTDQCDARGGRNRGQGDDSARAVHGVSRHLRHHHGRAHLGRGGRADAVRPLPRVHRSLDALRVRAGRPLGLGRRLAHEQGRARLRRGDRRAHQRRRVGAGGRSRPGRAQGLQPAGDPSAQRAVRSPRCRPALVRLVRVQRRERARGQRARGAGVHQYVPRSDGHAGGLGTARLLPHRARDRRRRCDGHRDRPRGHHPRCRVHQPHERPAPRRDRGVSELLHHCGSLADPARRFPGRLRGPRHRWHHGRAVDGRVRVQGLESCGERRTAGGERGTAWPRRRSAWPAPSSTPPSQPS